MPLYVLKNLLLAVFCLSLSACASQSVFTPYPLQAESIRSAITSDAKGDDLVQSLEERAESNDRLLYLLELGRFQQLKGRFAESSAAYAEAAAIFDRQDLAATIRASELAADSASLLTNDNARPYRGAGFERIALHHFQAFNYWAVGDLQGATVEFRKAALEQEFLAEAHAQAVLAAEAEASEKGIELEPLQEQFAGLDTLAGSVKSSYLNPYTYFTSAVFRESVGELNDALVDYKKALEMKPDSVLLREGVARVSAKLGDRVSPGSFKPMSQTEGRLVVLFEQEFVPARSEFSLSIPTFRGAWVSVAVPTYTSLNTPESFPLSVRVADELASTNTLVNYGALAAKHLKEQLPTTLVRQTLRAASKYELQRQSGESFGPFGQFIANVYTLVSERADLRSWLTLPFTGQAAELVVSEGLQEIELITDNGSRRINLKIEAGKTHVLHVVSSRQNMQVTELKL